MMRFCVQNSCVFFLFHNNNKHKSKETKQQANNAFQLATLDVLLLQGFGDGFRSKGSWRGAESSGFEWTCECGREQRGRACGAADGGTGWWQGPPHPHR